MNIGEWFHHLFNPHCPECMLEQQDNKVCHSCETLKMQLAIANQEKKQLLDSILEKQKPEVKPATASAMQPVTHRAMTWNMRRQMLEAEDRKAAEILAEQKKNIEKLEQELNIPSDADNTEGELANVVSGGRST